jgi:hypothetical protein
MNNAPGGSYIIYPRAFEQIQNIQMPFQELLPTNYLYSYDDDSSSDSSSDSEQLRKSKIFEFLQFYKSQHKFSRALKKKQNQSRKNKLKKTKKNTGFVRCKK